MPAVKGEFRLNPRDLAYGGSFQVHHEARVDFPLDDLDLATMFQNVHGNLQVGDQVTICAYENNKWDSPGRRLMEVGVVRIVTNRPETLGGQKRVRAVWMGPIVKIPVEAAGPDMPSPERKLYVKKEFGSGYTVQDEAGNVIERVKTKAEADAYIERLNPKATEAKAPEPDAKTPKAEKAA